MKYKIIELEVQTFIGKSFKLDFNWNNRLKRIPELFKETFKSKMFEKIMPFKHDFGYVGVTYNMDVENNVCNYLVGVDSLQTIEEVDSASFDKRRYLQVEIVGGLPQSIRDAEQEFITNIIPDDPFFDLLNGPIIEVYPEGDSSRDDYVCFLYLPVIEVLN